jgi:hypothetical protein
VGGFKSITMKISSNATRPSLLTCPNHGHGLLPREELIECRDGHFQSLPALQNHHMQVNQARTSLACPTRSATTPSRFSEGRWWRSGTEQAGLKHHAE